MNRRYPGGVPEDRQKQAEYEMDIIIQMGFPGYFLVVADFIMWAKNNGIAVGPGRGSAAGSIVAYAMGITDLDPIDARADLRAVPQPRACLHARCRHRLRRAPARRSDQVRDREVRRRQGRHDRYVRQDQGQERDQGLRPRPRLPVRDGRPAHQGHARRRPRQGHRPLRHHRPQAPALQRGGRDPGDVRERAGRQEGHRHRQGRRGTGPADGRARRRRHHVQRAHRRPRPGLGAAHRRRHHHAVGLPAVRVARPAEDGLPGPAQPHDHGRRRQDGEGQQGHRSGDARPAAGRPQDVRAAVPR